MNVSPKWITELSGNEIFVFGSNLDGFHGGGAAEQAMGWGAVWGQGVGLQGRTYAIPTMFDSADAMKPYVDDFLSFARAHPEMIFLVTELGCGIAGFKPDDVAPLFLAVAEDGIDNVRLPETFASILHKSLIKSALL